jgi:hypothetical protein
LQAYARGDLFAKRRKVMDEWGAFCSDQDKVVKLPRAVGA